VKEVDDVHIAAGGGGVEFAHVEGESYSLDVVGEVDAADDALVRWKGRQLVEGSSSGWRKGVVDEGFVFVVGGRSPDVGE